MLNLSNKIVLAHKGYFNKECAEQYRENSAEICALSGVKDLIGIIELDVRKSNDEVLYCYHGSLLEYWFHLKFPRNFLDIKNTYHVNSLEEILNVIPQEKIVFLDIKDPRITKEDIMKAFGDRKFKEVILGNKSISFLEKFNNMPHEFVKMLNGNIFMPFYDFSKLRRRNFKYVEAVFPFQVNQKLIDVIQKSGMEFRIAGLFFRNKESYWRKINRYNIKHVSSDFI